MVHSELLFGVFKALRATDCYVYYSPSFIYPSPGYLEFHQNRAYLFQNPLCPKAIREAGRSYRTHSKQPIYWESLNAKKKKNRKRSEICLSVVNGEPYSSSIVPAPLWESNSPFYPNSIVNRQCQLDLDLQHTKGRRRGMALLPGMKFMITPEGVQ